MRLSTPRNTVAITSRRLSPFALDKRAEIGEQAWAALAVRPPRLVLVDKGKKLVAGDTLRIGRPIPPAVGRLDRRAKFLARQLRFLLALLLKIIKEFEKHDPSEQRQPVKVAVEALVLAHDVARGLDQASQGLRGRLRRFAVSFFLLRAIEHYL